MKNSKTEGSKTAVLKVEKYTYKNNCSNYKSGLALTHG